MSHPMRDFRRILDDAGRAFGPIDVYPAAPQYTDLDRLRYKAAQAANAAHHRDAARDLEALDRRLAAFPPRVQTRPPLRLVLALCAALAALAAVSFGLGWFAQKALANAAATVTQAEAGE